MQWAYVFNRESACHWSSCSGTSIHVLLCLSIIRQATQWQQLFSILKFISSPALYRVQFQLCCGFPNHDSLVFSDECPSTLPCIPWWQFMVICYEASLPFCHVWRVSCIVAECWLPCRNLPKHNEVSQCLQQNRSLRWIQTQFTGKTVYHFQVMELHYRYAENVCSCWSYNSDTLSARHTKAMMLITYTFRMALIYCDIYSRY
jgi:hypothetical protein